LYADRSLGSSKFGVLDVGGFQDRDAESTRAADALEGRFRRQRTQPVLLTSSSTGSFDAPGGPPPIRGRGHMTNASNARSASTRISG
jgi:hypothetical protein